MKKTFLFSIALLLWVTVFQTTTLSAYAKNSEKVVSETIEYFEDGSSMTITVIEESPITRGTSYNTSGTKRCVMKNNSGKEICSFTIQGIFSVNSGSSAICTAASCSFSITDNAWEIDSTSSYCSGNQAIGDATFIRKLLSIIIDSKSCHVVLSCDSEGNLS